MFSLAWIFGIRIGTHPPPHVSVAIAKYLFDYLLYPEEASKMVQAPVVRAELTSVRQFLITPYKKISDFRSVGIGTTL